MKTRIAPTPSGYLHVGNGAAFVLAWKLARAAGGRVLLRIDDLDAERARPAYVQDIFDTLQWLGIGWEEGPRSPQELTEHWSQHHRLAQYHRLLAELRAAGHLYACDCSRSLIAKRGTTAAYDGHCRHRNLDLDGPEMAWRLRLPEAGTVALREWPTGTVRQHALDLPDPVLRQRNGRPAYHVASLADDVHFGVDLVVRGMDLLPSTLVQSYLAGVLGLEAFVRTTFLHHALLTGPEGTKLSKSAGAAALRQWRETGRSPQEVHRLADQLSVAP